MVGLVGNESHGFALASVTDAESDAMAERMARAGVSLVTHGGASQPLVPVLRLRERGVELFAGSDDVRDTWSPYGNADMLERAMLIGWRSDFRRDDQIAVAFDVCSAAGARALQLGPWGIEVGAPAHLSVAAAGCLAEAVCARPLRKLVLHAGRVVARDGEVVKEAPASG
jgi:cytosine/adenosine deaminase-related metal-dependent hydrolase